MHPLVSISLKSKTDLMVLVTQVAASSGKESISNRADLLDSFWVFPSSLGPTLQKSSSHSQPVPRWSKKMRPHTWHLTASHIPSYHIIRSAFNLWELGERLKNSDTPQEPGNHKLFPAVTPWLHHLPKHTPRVRGMGSVLPACSLMRLLRNRPRVLVPAWLLVS